MGGGDEEARRRKRGRSPAASASGSSGGGSGSHSDSEASAGVDARKGKEASTARGERSRDGSEHKKRDKRADKDRERDRDQDRKKKKKDKKRREKEKLKEAKRFLKQQLRAAAAGGTGTAAHPGLKAYASLVGGGRGEQPQPARTEEEEGLDKEPLPDDIPKLTVEAYFDKAAEFTAWLQSHRQLYFNELSSDEARDLFAEFVEDWNGHRLSAKYYKGEVVAPSRLTSHRWNIRGAPSQPSSATAGVGMAAAMEEERLQRLQHRDERRAKLRKDRQDQKEVLDEMFPKATGRDAKVEKRMARREEARARAVSPEAAGVPGGGRDIMGAGDDDSFAAAQQREARRREWQDKKRAAKREELSARAAQLQQEEDAKMADLKALVSQAGPMAIRKRT